MRPSLVVSNWKSSAQHLIRALCPQPRGGDGGGAEALPLAPLGRHVQALLAPQALDLLAVSPANPRPAETPTLAVSPDAGARARVNAGGRAGRRRGQCFSADDAGWSGAGR